MSDVPKESRTVSLWAGVLGAPLLWAFQLNLNYMIVPRICRNHHTGVFHLLSVLFLLAVIACGALCWMEWVHIGRAGSDDDEPGGVGRVHFLSVLGMLSSLLFAIAIIAQALASFYINPCWD